MSFIQLSTGNPGEVLYAVFYSHESGWIWDNANSLWRSTTGSEVSANGGLDYDANWGNVAVLMTEDVGSDADATGHYQLKIPTNLASIVESVDAVIRKRVGASPDITDPVVAAGTHAITTHGAYLVTKTG